MVAAENEFPDRDDGYTVTVLEAAERLRMWPQSVRFLIGRGKLRAVLSGDGKYLIRSGDIERYEPTKGGQVSPGLRRVRVPKDADREGRYTHSPALRETIARCGMSIQGFADAMGVDVSLFYHIEKGNRNASPEYRAKAAALLDRPEAELFRKIAPETP